MDKWYFMTDVCKGGSAMAIWIRVTCDDWDSCDKCSTDLGSNLYLADIWILAKDSSRWIDSLQRRPWHPVVCHLNTEASCHLLGLIPAMPYTFLLTYFPTCLCLFWVEEAWSASLRSLHCLEQRSRSRGHITLRKKRDTHGPWRREVESLQAKTPLLAEGPCPLCCAAGPLCSWRCLAMRMVQRSKLSFSWALSNSWEIRSLSC